MEGELPAVPPTLVVMGLCTSHQVLDHLRQHLHHRDVTDPSQGHGGSGQDEISSQDGLKETEDDPASSVQGNRKC